ncbi:MAG: hypothetical protein Q7N50_03130 [Armatimonadota bacterium]|nr:hypothetical protein [Armatimonadota bacterium]
MSKIRFLISGLIILALFIGVLFITNSFEQQDETERGIPVDALESQSYKIKIHIINEKSLSPQRLADALYAKASLLDDDDLISQAAKLDPNDPVYLYRQTFSGSGILRLFAMGEEKNDQRPNTRLLLKKCIAIDPNYLPARYAIALQELDYDQAKQELEKIAEIDKSNAKPYYVMAFLRYRLITRGNKVIPESDGCAFSLSKSEWAEVLELLKQGNSRPELRATQARLPSSRDIRVVTDGNIWPKAAVDSYMYLYLNDILSGGLEEMPCGFPTGAQARQIARQAMWEAKKAYKNGNRAEGMEMLSVVHDFADKYASSKPNRFIPFLVASAVHNILWKTQEDILQSAGDMRSLEKMRLRRAEWKRAIKLCMPLISKTSVNVPDVKISPKQTLQYTDFAAEEEGVEEILKLLSLHNH